MKSLQKMHEEKVKKMESEKFQIQELLEKELADKQKITNNLETSKSQLKELTIEVALSEMDIQSLRDIITQREKQRQ